MLVRSPLASVLVRLRNEPVVYKLRQWHKVDVGENLALARVLPVEQEVVLQPVLRRHVADDNGRSRERIVAFATIPALKQLFSQDFKSIATVYIQ